jgi:hypothetical protein
MHVIYTSAPLTVDEVTALRQSVRAQLDDGKEVVALPPGCIMELLHSSSEVPNDARATKEVADETVRRYKARLKELGIEVPSIPPPPVPPPTRIMHGYGVETKASKAATLEWRIRNTVAPPMPPRR